jgi:hypothetical protein
MVVMKFCETPTRGTATPCFLRVRTHVQSHICVLITYCSQIGPSEIVRKTLKISIHSLSQVTWEELYMRVKCVTRLSIDNQGVYLMYITLASFSHLQSLTQHQSYNLCSVKGR